MQTCTVTDEELAPAQSAHDSYDSTRHGPWCLRHYRRAPTDKEKEEKPKEEEKLKKENKKMRARIDTFRKHYQPNAREDPKDTAIVGNITKLLPANTFLMFQTLAPLATNEGLCHRNELIMTSVMLVVLASACAIVIFTDTFQYEGKVYHGIVTKWGLWNPAFKGDPALQGLRKHEREYAEFYDKWEQYQKDILKHEREYADYYDKWEQYQNVMGKPPTGDGPTMPVDQHLNHECEYAEYYKNWEKYQNDMCEYAEGCKKWEQYQNDKKATGDPPTVPVVKQAPTVPVKPTPPVVKAEPYVLGAIYSSCTDQFKVKSIDFLHAVLSVAAFATITLLTAPVTTCFYPSISPTIVKTTPLLVWFVVSAVFAFTPPARNGVAHPLSAVKISEADIVVAAKAKEDAAKANVDDAAKTNVDDDDAKAKDDAAKAKDATAKGAATAPEKVAPPDPNGKDGAASSGQQLGDQNSKDDNGSQANTAAISSVQDDTGTQDLQKVDSACSPQANKFSSVAHEGNALFQPTADAINSAQLSAQLSGLPHSFAHLVPTFASVEGADQGLGIQRSIVTPQQGSPEFNGVLQRQDSVIVQVGDVGSTDVPKLRESSTQLAEPGDLASTSEAEKSKSQTLSEIRSEK